MAPDLVLLNADIYTMDALVPRAQALAVSKGRVAAVGDSVDIRALARAATRVIDAGGKLVLPGFQDTHIHLLNGGYAYHSIAILHDCRNIADLQGVLRSFAASHPAGWVRGTGWQPGIFTQTPLDRRIIDVAVPDRPCLIIDCNVHSACLNTKGCEAVGLAPGVGDPPNGHFVLDEAGVPTGMLHEDAVEWALERMPKPTDEDYANGVRHAQALCNRHGITGVLDASVADLHNRIYHRLDQAGALTLRIAATARVDPSEATLDALERIDEMRRKYRSEQFYVHSAKFFIDGIFENRTAAMLSPYSDAEGGNAPLMFDPQQIRDLFVAFDAARFQIHTHVIGDGAVRAALDGLEAARHANGRWPSLHQLAHVQVVDPSDFPRFRSLGTMANIQPLWARQDPTLIDMVTPMIGNERGRWIYPFRSLIDAGASYCLSSDWSVSTLNPFPIIETAITRAPSRRMQQGPAFLPEQRMTRLECVAGYTIHAAAAAWRSQDTGSLSIGKSADLIVLDRDIFTCDAHDISEAAVLLTVLAGRDVYRAGDFTG